MKRLNHAGLVFTFRGADALVGSMEQAARKGTSPTSLGSPLDVAPAGREPGPPQETAAAQVVCELYEATESVSLPETPYDWGWLSWEWNAREARVSTRVARARLARSGAGYAVEAWLPPNVRAARTLLGGLYSAILHDLGGFILHSGSVLSGGGVVAFVGPSGAGKSTACRHMHGEPTFSVDRMAVLPRPSAPKPESAMPAGVYAWYGYPMPGGTLIDPDKPRAAPHWSPLRAILRVQQTPGDARLEPCSAVAAVALLRESTFHACVGVGVERAILDRLERLAAQVPVGRVHFSLGPSLTPGVSRWLCQQEHAHV